VITVQKVDSLLLSVFIGPLTGTDVVKPLILSFFC